ncbi:MAG: DUF692 domain-containing protein [Gammaproteobacteria bacterium]|nr:DUF692 domain-containing protein [Gammaproteobacteria bacterium]
MTHSKAIQGSGLGLRRDIMSQLASSLPNTVDFMEVAPENWINIGGSLGRDFRALTERYPFVFHGLSLSIGGPEPIDVELVNNIKSLMQQHNVTIYSEHLTYCSDGGHLYDLMPIPFTEEAINYVVKRIQQVQDILEAPLVLENASYYAAPAQEMTEIEFVNQVVANSGCELLLDVNNIYVNAINHGYDPLEFLRQLPGERIRYCHIAGHYDEADDLKVDTHGSNVKAEVWELLHEAYQLFGVFPTLLERDFNFPELSELLQEVAMVKSIQNKFAQRTQPVAS